MPPRDPFLEQACLDIGDYQIEILSLLGMLSAGIRYFKVKVLGSGNSSAAEFLGLLRVGAATGGLGRELRLREAIGNYGMVSALLAHDYWQRATLEAEEAEISGINAEIVPESSTTADQESDSDYLEEEYYPEKDPTIVPESQQLLLLTSFPDPDNTLATWLQQSHSYEEALSLAIAICQCCSYLSQRQWGLVDLLPELIEIGKPLQFFDLTSAYPLGIKPETGIVGNYCAPELATGQTIEAAASSYLVGAFLYQATHGQLPQSLSELDLTIHKIPRIYQLLKICLSSLIEERFSLPQLLNTLVNARTAMRSIWVQWQVASHSTIGLSTTRLVNEDSYGVRQQQVNTSQTLLLGAIADGMGGMSQGEVASQVAIKTLLEAPLPAEFKTIQQQADWLITLFEQANTAVVEAVREGGTTLSAVLAVANRLAIAHVGDSRIYLLREGKLQQLSEDHSLVAMMVASGQMSLEESLEHPDRNILIKSLGSKPRLSDRYVQELTQTIEERSLVLVDRDILLLCSDGVWDLVSDDELAEIFRGTASLQGGVDEVINRVLKRNASDNATLLALQCSLKNVEKSTQIL